MLKSSLPLAAVRPRASRRRRPRTARRPAPDGSLHRNGAARIALVQSSSLPALVQKELERMILAGELPAGSKLNEAAVAERLGVSRGPVREAFRALEESGLVRLEKNRGVFVRQIAVDEADEIYELRAVLDEFVGRRLAQTRHAEQRARVCAPRRPDGAARRRRATSTPTSRPTSSSTIGWSSSPATRSCSRIYRRLVNELQSVPPRDARARRARCRLDARASRDRRPDRRRATPPPPAARCSIT